MGAGRKKEKLWQKSFFSDKKVLKSCKIDICWYKTDAKQEEIKELVAESYNFHTFHILYHLKTWNTV